MFCYGLLTAEIAEISLCYSLSLICPVWVIDMVQPCRIRTGYQYIAAVQYKHVPMLFDTCMHVTQCTDIFYLVMQVCCLLIFLYHL